MYIYFQLNILTSTTNIFCSQRPIFSGHVSPVSFFSLVSKNLKVILKTLLSIQRRGECGIMGAWGDVAVSEVKNDFLEQIDAAIKFEYNVFLKDP